MNGKVSELVSSRIGQTVANVRAYGDAFYNVMAKPYEATGDGVTNDTAIFQRIVNDANAAGRRAVYCPHGTYYVTALTDDEDIVWFGDNASFTGGYTGTINQMGQFGPSEADFDELKADYAKEVSKIVNVMGYGAVGDGETDDTEAFHTAIAVAELLGLDVGIPSTAKGYNISGYLNIPKFVSLIGLTSRTPVNSPYDPISSIDNTGPTLLIRNTSQPALQLVGNNAIKNIRFFYPDQTDTNPPIVYPPTIYLNYGAADIDIENCVIVNGYIGIDAYRLHQRLNVSNCKLWCMSRNIRIDFSGDVDRITDVHIWPFWSKDTTTGKSLEYIQNNGIGIETARADNLIVDRLFVLHQNRGILFTSSENGTTYGQISNSSFESNTFNIHIEAANAENAISISNCKFSIANDVELITTGCGILTNTTTEGNVMISNCAFWGGGENNESQLLVQSDDIEVNVTNCTFYKVKTAQSMIKIVGKGNVSIGNSFFGPVSSSGGHIDLSGCTGTVGVIVHYNRMVGGLTAYNPSTVNILGSGTNYDVN